MSWAAGKVGSRGKWDMTVLLGEAGIGAGQTKARDVSFPFSCVLPLNETKTDKTFFLSLCIYTSL